MKNIKKIVLVAVLFVILLIATSCSNRAFFDTAYNFDTAIVYLSDGSIVSGKVQSWLDFEDGDQIQVKIDGITYLVHSSNVTLMDK